MPAETVDAMMCMKVHDFPAFQPHRGRTREPQYEYIQ